MTELAPFGTWRSPISAAKVVEASARIEEVRVASDDTGELRVWWSEGRPNEAGRSQIMMRRPDGTLLEVLGPEGSARSRVHEYGGAGWWLFGETVFYVDASDQRIWRKDPGFDPEPITPVPAPGAEVRHADGVVTHDGRWVICVEETHPPPAPGVEAANATEVVNRLIAVPSIGGQPVVLWSGSDFVSSPRLDPRGRHLAWLAWSHPDMPWDATELHVASLDATGLSPVLDQVRVVAGGDGESIVQPDWDPDGRLWFCSDRDDWWNLYHFPQAGPPTGAPVHAARGAFEVAQPAWQFGASRYAFLDDGRVVYAASSDGVDHLGVHDPVSGRADRVPVPFTSMVQVRAAGASVVLVGAGWLTEPTIATALVGRGGAASTPLILRPPRDLGVSSALLAGGSPITFPTSGGRASHGIVYWPTNPDYAGEAGERPPLVVMIHGGPTAAAIPALALRVQYWTSRGFAVCDVNYRGSTGFGRRFRNELRRQWGVADVEDCVAAARFLADAGRVDPARCVIRGGSAGGFTTLRALMESDAFVAGTCMYGVSDLEALATDTHKFESRYLDRLVGDYPAERDVYVERSPIHHVDRLRRPVIVMQGSADRVVPPNQSEMIVEALRRNAVPHAYLLFDGEGHGFRRAESIARALEAELSFYLQVFGLPHPPDVERVQIVNG